MAEIALSALSDVHDQRPPPPNATWIPPSWTWQRRHVCRATCYQDEQQGCRQARHSMGHGVGQLRLGSKGRRLVRAIEHPSCQPSRDV
jgi:hypothetical protein